MRIVKGAAIGIALTALAGVAVAADIEKSKVMAVALPDGSIEHIRYTGDTPPRVLFVPRTQPVSMFDTVFGPDSAFAQMDLISAAMDRQMAAMLMHARMAQQQAAIAASQIPNGAPGITLTSDLPAGSVVSYRVVSTTDGKGCTQSIQISSQGAGQDPRMIRTSSGDCGAARTPAGPTRTIAPATPQHPAIVPTSAPAPATAPLPSTI